MKETVLTFTPEIVGVRLDKWLAEQDSLSLTRSVIQTRIEQGDVTVNGRVVPKNYKIRSNDTVQVVIPEPVSLELIPESIPLEIVYEDDDLLVVNKPKGMVVHPAPGNLTGTLVHALLYHCGGRLSGINGVIRPGIVHRIDKNTSGLLMVAKNDNAHVKLSEQIQAHTFTREYQAIALGRFTEKSGTIHAPIGRHPVDRKKMCVTQKNSKDAVTHYTVLAESGNYTHLCLRLETGRTHQIRVHLAYIGHSVLGDDVYGKSFSNLTGQCLHAGKIGFVHPVTGEYMEFTSPLPDYFEAALRKLHFV
ncbi:MAG: RluA family pseudouridine synthase [Oscillospiraceae bacterium]|nr:RluA family pseudouridine synthase [Oscillospiraceae bacterium]